MRPKILVSRKISDLAEEKLQKEFEVTLNPKDQPIPESDLIKIANDQLKKINITNFAEEE